MKPFDVRALRERLFTRETMKWAGLTFAAIVFFTLLLFIYYSKDLPSKNNVGSVYNAESTKMYDRTGTVVLYDIYDVQKRTVVSYDDIPGYVRDATIVAEDDNFYQHFGIDVTGIIRGVVLKPLSGERAQGGSTITQQFIKNALFTPRQGVAPRSPWRKVKEAILAIELEWKYSKDDILTFYLNQIPYGSSAYGVETASQTYFEKSVRDVTVGEAALLAALPNAPSYYLNNPDQLEARRQYVLTRMHDLGYITEDQYVEAKNEKIAVSETYTGITAPHFVLEVRSQLEEKYGTAFVEQGGLKIITTLDATAQRVAEEAVSQWEGRNTNYRAQNAALTAIDPYTGQVLAMVGSKDYFNEDIDGNVNVAMRPNQPGSSFKPFAYAEAFRKGYTPDTILYDVPTEFNPSCPASATGGVGGNGGACYHPKNYDLAYYGPMRMKEALAQSRNVPAVKTLYLAGVKDTVELATEMGITTLTDPDRYGLALVLGGGDVTLLEETAAFGVFATRGTRNNPAFILEVRDNSGEILEEFSQDSKEVLESEIADQITYALSVNEFRAPVFGSQNYLNIPGLAVAAKTGTTQEYRDAWTVGYTPSISVGVWVGNNDNSPMAGGADGSVVAAPIWNTFMRQFYAQKQNDLQQQKESAHYFKLPSVQEESSFDQPSIPRTGKAVLDGVVNPQNPHSILHDVLKDDPQGGAPSNPADSDSLYNNWERAVRAWAGLGLGEEGGAGSDAISFNSPAGEYAEGESIPVSIVISSTEPVREVSLTLDGETLGTYAAGGATQFTVSETIASISAGEHTLSARALTESGLLFIQTRAFTVTAADSQQSRRGNNSEQN